MKLARVQGTVVCTIKHPTYEGRRLMLCALLDAQGNPTGKQEIAVDLVQAGVGDRVLIMSEGNGVRQLLGSDAGPIRDVIVGVVDLISVDHPQKNSHEHPNPNELSTEGSDTASESDHTPSHNIQDETSPSETIQDDSVNQIETMTHPSTLKGAS